MSEKRGYNFSIEGRPLYPHVKLTREPFPRLLATRMIHDDDAEYFGPFLNRTSARILIDFLNRTFRLRSCTVDVDGSFPYPCTQYYARRCVAPCVSVLCGPEEYANFVHLARLFLRNDRDEFEFLIGTFIESAADRLDFESAAYFRDISFQVRHFWAERRLNVWTNDATDTFVVEREADVVTVFIITTRGVRSLGSRAFTFQVFEESDISELLADLIFQFYSVGVPREIRIPFELSDRRAVVRELTQRTGRAVKIVVEGKVPGRIAALKGLARIKLETELENLKPSVSPKVLGKQLARLFDLERPPARIEAFDAAHISGTYSTAGMAVWQDGRLVTDEYRQGLLEETGETATLGKFIAQRIPDTDGHFPDLILVDGGKAQIGAAVSAIGGRAGGAIPVIGAVKPRGKHSEVSHFITESGLRVDFDPNAASLVLLKQLRDEAHALANAAHRQSRDMAHFYEWAVAFPSLNERERQELKRAFGTISQLIGLDPNRFSEVIGRERLNIALRDLARFGEGKAEKVLPLIVPLRFDDPHGKASDLRPINAPGLA